MLGSFADYGVFGESELPARTGGRGKQAYCIILPSKKSSLHKVFGLNLSIHAREARGLAISPYAALRAARISTPVSDSENGLGLIFESLLNHARTYFATNS